MDINKDLKDTRDARLEKAKKDFKDVKTARPLGYIFPKRIQSILNGETPVISMGYAGASKAKRSVGDTWEDEDGKLWEQKEGYAISIPKVLSELRMPETCPQCKTNMQPTRLNEKFYWLRGKCFDCHIREEQQMIIRGSFKYYEDKLILQNQMAFLKDTKIAFEDFLKNLKNEQQFINEDGTIEKWSGDTSKVREFCIGELKQINETLEKLEKELQEATEKFDELEANYQGRSN